MNKNLLVSTLVLSTLLGTVAVNADNTVVNTGEAVESGAAGTSKVKGLVDGATNVVKKAAKTVEKTLDLSESDIGKTEGDDVPAEPEKAVEKPIAKKQLSRQL